MCYGQNFSVYLTPKKEPKYRSLGFLHVPCYKYTPYVYKTAFSQTLTSNKDLPMRKII